MTMCYEMQFKYNKNISFEANFNIWFEMNRAERESWGEKTLTREESLPIFKEHFKNFVQNG